MIIDITGTVLTPGNLGKDCDGYGKCCDECDYLLCCTTQSPKCNNCIDQHCPKANKNAQLPKRKLG